MGLNLFWSVYYSTLLSLTGAWHERRPGTFLYVSYSKVKDKQCLGSGTFRGTEVKSCPENQNEKYSRLYYKWLVGWLILNVPVNNFTVMLGRSHRFLGITSTFREITNGHSTCG